MLDFRDFYCIADYANMNWKGGFAPIEIAENAYNYLRDFEWSKENGKVANSIKVLLANLDEDIANGEELEDVRYWTSEIRKELGLNEPIIQSLNGLSKGKPFMDIYKAAIAGGNGYTVKYKKRRKGK